jgi:hypothetical protein
MEPNQPQLGHNPYDFIINPQKPVQHPLGIKIPGVGGGAFGSKLVVIIGGAVILMIIFGIAAAVLGGGGNNVTQLVGIAETQAGIVNVATFGYSEVSQTSTLNLAVDTQLTVQSQQIQMVKYITSEGTKVSAKELLSKVLKSTQLQLTAAQQNSTVDPVFAQIMQNDLQSYSSELKTAYNTSKSSSAKSILATDYNQVQMLLKLVPSLSSLQT